MRLMRYTTGVAMAALMAGTTVGPAFAQTAPAQPAPAAPAPSGQAAGTLNPAAEEAPRRAAPASRCGRATPGPNRPN